jgi:hypothetical protein
LLSLSQETNYDKLTNLKDKHVNRIVSKKMA